MEKIALTITISSTSDAPEELTRRMLVSNVIYSSLKEAGFTDIEAEVQPSMLVDNFPTLLDYIRLCAPRLFSSPIAIHDESSIAPYDINDLTDYEADQIFDQMDKRALRDARQAMRSKSRNVPY